MIPKKIHYFWFGRGEKSSLEKECISRFAQFAPGCQIIEWNEDSFNVLAHPYSAQAYQDKKWAFVSDYARLKVLYDEGGIYLDTDMYLVKDISDLFLKGTFFGKEDEKHINAAVFGAAPGDRFVGDILMRYDSLEQRAPIPKVITEVYNDKYSHVIIFDKSFFYPFSQETISTFNKNNAPKVSYMVHMWNYSWGNPVAKFIRKSGLYNAAKNTSDKLGLKNILKKILKME